MTDKAGFNKQNNELLLIIKDRLESQNLNKDVTKYLTNFKDVDDLAIKETRRRYDFE